MKCLECGREQEAGEKFCAVCGTKFPEEDGKSCAEVEDANQAIEVDLRTKPSMTNDGSPSNTASNGIMNNKLKSILKIVLGIFVAFCFVVKMSVSNSKKSHKNNSSTVRQETRYDDYNDSRSSVSNDGPNLYVGLWESNLPTGGTIQIMLYEDGTAAITGGETIEYGTYKAKSTSISYNFQSWGSGTMRYDSYTGGLKHPNGFVFHRISY